MKKNQGSILIGSVIFMMLSIVVIQILVTSMQRQSSSSMKQRKSSTAKQFAEAALDRGEWKLKNSETVWTQAVTGTNPAGYSFNQVYTDVLGGFYRIKFTVVTTVPPVIKISAEGKDKDSQEVRAVEATLTQPNPNSFSLAQSPPTEVPPASTPW